MAGEQRHVADLLVRCLEREGVTCVFGVPGEENIHLTDALAASSMENLRLTDALGELSGPF